MFNWFKGASRPALPSGNRVYAIGDIHGRLDLFERLLTQIRHDSEARPPADVSLILLGDLIDRGPESRGVVSKAREGVPWAKTIVLMGNHEAVMLDVLDGQTETLAQWLRFGGVETLLSWGIPRALIAEGTRTEILDALRAAVTTEERTLLARMRTSLRMGDYYFVHAGIRPEVPLDKQNDEDRLWIREEFLDSKKKHGAMIVHGHSINPEIEQLPNRIGLDTGAYASGKLTALGLQDQERWFLSTGGND